MVTLSLSGEHSPPTAFTQQQHWQARSLMTKWHYTIFLLQDTDSVRALNQWTHPPTNTCKVSTTGQVPLTRQGKGKTPPSWTENALSRCNELQQLAERVLGEWVAGDLCLFERQGKPPKEVLCAHAITSVLSCWGAAPAGSRGTFRMNGVNEREAQWDKAGGWAWSLFLQGPLYTLNNIFLGEVYIAYT